MKASKKTVSNWWNSLNLREKMAYVIASRKDIHLDRSKQHDNVNEDDIANIYHANQVYDYFWRSKLNN